MMMAAGTIIARAQSGRNPAWRFGVVGAYEAPDEARDLGVGWERITFDWAAFQPEGPDDFETDALEEAWLEAAEEADREVVGLITHTPTWASDSGAVDAVPNGLNFPLDNPANVWAAFVTRLAEYYAPLGVHHWIIYDEPDVRPGEGVVQFAGEVEDYAAVLWTAYRAIKAVDPDATIHIAAMNGWTDIAAGREPYLARLIQVLQADPGAAEHNTYFDSVTVRVGTATQAVSDRLAEAQAILEGMPGKTIWLETSISPALETARQQDVPLLGVTPEHQADFIVQAAALGLAADAERFSVYRLSDSEDEALPWGLIRANGTHRPAFDAYRMVIELFSPTLSATRYTRDDAEMIVFDQEDREVIVFWARGTTSVRFAIASPEIGENATLYDTQGRRRRLISDDTVYPAAFTVEAPAALPDENGFLTVAGSPYILVLDKQDALRVVYVLIDSERFRLR